MFLLPMHFFFINGCLFFFLIDLLLLQIYNLDGATFLHVFGSELIQKYLGDGPKLVRELFRVADELSPLIVFIDEIEAVCTKKVYMMLILVVSVKYREPSVLRPSRIDGKIEFLLPDIKTRHRIFQIHTSRMTLANNVNLEEFVMTKDEFSGADIKTICTKPGLLALREHRMKVTHADFKKAKENVMFNKKGCLRDSTCELLIRLPHNMKVCLICRF
uniref:Uncharacterized protein n=1 Tax=Musa acuminata subsp. malaccensis TaxID=214687 RepID=A0A804INZ9_MUSAM